MPLRAEDPDSSASRPPEEPGGPPSGDVRVGRGLAVGHPAASNSAPNAGRVLERLGTVSDAEHTPKHGEFLGHLVGGRVGAGHPEYLVSPPAQGERPRRSPSRSRCPAGTPRRPRPRGAESGGCRPAGAFARDGVPDGFGSSAPRRPTRSTGSTRQPPPSAPAAEARPGSPALHHPPLWSPWT